ncbi:ArdC-like ssDNA-binding domain-containing protein [Arthrobacter psychrolactophilus]
MWLGAVRAMDKYHRKHGDKFLEVREAAAVAPAISEHPDNEEEVGRHHAGPRPSNEERLAGLTQQLQSLLENAISTPGRWHMLLDTSATLWRYSGGNIALLMAQMEERGQQQPLLVAGFREWERHGRNVLKGEHALWVLAPRTATKKTEAPPEADAKSSVTLADHASGGTKETDHRRIVGWRAQSVFDVSQTEGQPIYIPRPMMEVGSSPMGLWSSLVKFAQNQGFAVEQSMSQYGLSSGYTDFAGHKIQVGAWLGQDQRVAVLAHELGHVCLHGPDDNLGKLYGSGLDHRGLAEVEAESVAYTVLRAHGIDRSAQSGSYLAGWADQVVALEQSRQSGSPTEKEPTSRLEIARSTLARVTSASRSILEVTQPHNQGGKPATAGVAIAYERGDLTGPVTGHQAIGTTPKIDAL